MSSRSSSETCDLLSAEIQQRPAVDRPTTSNLDTSQQLVVQGKSQICFKFYICNLRHKIIFKVKIF